MSLFFVSMKYRRQANVVNKTGLFSSRFWKLALWWGLNGRGRTSCMRELESPTDGKRKTDHRRQEEDCQGPLYHSQGPFPTDLGISQETPPLINHHPEDQLPICQPLEDKFKPQANQSQQSHGFREWRGPTSHSVSSGLPWPWRDPWPCRTLVTLTCLSWSYWIAEFLLGSPSFLSL